MGESFSTSEMQFCILQLKLLSKVPRTDQSDTEKGKLISLSSSRWDHKGVRNSSHGCYVT